MKDSWLNFLTFLIVSSGAVAVIVLCSSLSYLTVQFVLGRCH